ncbi:vesicle-associated protein 4-1-like [Silene latifolia]|uniref:vesicle-associated protein 4-1-like n=1 Tax=Silene latifolia TaxID=37657 RepID=UPI003D777744
MAVTSQRSSWTDTGGDDDDKVVSLCKIPFWTPSNSNSNNASHTTSSTTSTTSSYHSNNNGHHNVQPQRLGGYPYYQGQSNAHQNSVITVSSIAKSLLPPRRRLRLDPSNKLYFPYEPGKQVKSAITIKNICKAHVAFKFQTTAPKSCYMRPPGGILAPGESLVAVVFKFVEPPDKNDKQSDQKSRVKFKIMSLKMHGDQLDYIPELFEEQRDQVSVEQILRVVFLDTERPSPVLEKLKRQLAEADAAVETRRKPQEEAAGPRIAGEGLVIDEWKERRERYLAQQQGDATDTI